MCDREIKEKSLVRTFTSFLNRGAAVHGRAIERAIGEIKEKAWYALLLLSLTGAASMAESSMFDFQGIPQHNGLSKKMAPVDGSRFIPE